MILRIDDTDLERNTEQSLQSIFEGLKWLNLDWDEQYRQSDRRDLHRVTAEVILEKGMAYRDFTPAAEESSVGWLCNAGQREISRDESDRRAATGESFVLRYRVPRDRPEIVRFTDAVYGEQAKLTTDIEDFALLRSNGAPTYHLASCADDIDLRISHVVRGQDHLTNTFKHVLIFRAAGFEPPKFAHLPLLVAPDGAKLSKRKHGPVVSVTTYRDAGFLPDAFINFLCLLGWSPKDDRERMTRDELVSAFSFEGINRSNPVINFTDETPFDAKALWLNSEYIRSMSGPDLSAELAPIVEGAGFNADRIGLIAPLIQERIKLLRDVLIVGDFFFVTELPPYDSVELIPKKGDVAMALSALEAGRAALDQVDFTHDALDAALRSAAEAVGIKAGQLFESVRVAVCGRKSAPPLFGTLEALGRDTCIARIDGAIAMLK